MSPVAVKSDLLTTGRHADERRIARVRTFERVAVPSGPPEVVTKTSNAVAIARAVEDAESCLTRRRREGVGQGRERRR